MDNAPCRVLSADGSTAAMFSEKQLTAAGRSSDSASNSGSSREIDASVPYDVDGTPPVMMEAPQSPGGLCARAQHVSDPVRLCWHSLLRPDFCT